MSHCLSQHRVWQDFGPGLYSYLGIVDPNYPALFDIPLFGRFSLIVRPQQIQILLTHIIFRMSIRWVKSQTFIGVESAFLPFDANIPDSTFADRSDMPPR